MYALGTVILKKIFSDFSTNDLIEAAIADCRLVSAIQEMFEAKVNSVVQIDMFDDSVEAMYVLNCFRPHADHIDIVDVFCADQLESFAQMMPFWTKMVKLTMNDFREPMNLSAFTLSNVKRHCHQSIVLQLIAACPNLKKLTLMLNGASAMGVAKCLAEQKSAIEQLSISYELIEDNTCVYLSKLDELCELDLENLQSATNEYLVSLARAVSGNVKTLKLYNHHRR